VSPFAALHGLRVGCVQYLNARPLIAPYDGKVIFEHPARLADLLAAGEIDVALVPVFEALRQPDFPVADGVAIASRGPVYSVILAYRGPLEEIRGVSLDPTSRTSNNLLRCLLAEFHGLRPDFDFAENSQLEEHHGRVLIGDHAIRFREEQRAGVACLDLGEEWLVRTGLPFVYAVWQIRPEVADPAAVAGALRAIKTAGLRRVREIGRLQHNFAPEFAERYLTTYIKFELSDCEKAALERFSALLRKHELIPGTHAPLIFV